MGGGMGHIQSNVLLSYPTNDSVAAMASSAMVVAVVACLPINIFPLRQLVFPMETGTFKPLEAPIILLSASLVAYTVPNLGKIFDLTGATACLSCCYLLPCFLVAKQDGPGHWQWTLPNAFTLVVGVSGSLLSLWVLVAQDQ